MITMTAREIADAVSGILTKETDLKFNSVCTDSRKVTGNDVFFALVGEKFDAHDFLSSMNGKCNLAVVNREISGVDFPQIIVDDTLLAIGRLGKYHKENKANLSLTLSLTGSVGKTTTKEMTYAVISQKYNTCKTEGNYNNHIGVPLTLLSLNKDDEALVCEMGMSARGEIEYLSGLVGSDIAMITNIGHSHIEKLGSREEIRNAKLEILNGLKDNGTLIVNGDEPLLREIDTKVKIFRVGLTKGLDVWADNVIMGQEEITFDAHAFGETFSAKLCCTGEHNVLNALFAICAGYVAGVDRDDIVKGLAEYKTVGLRQKIYLKNGICVIADCYNAGVESMTASVKVLSRLDSKRRVAVLGDMLELGENSPLYHSDIGRLVGECHIDALFTFGENARYIDKHARENGVKKAYHSLIKADVINELKSYLEEGDTVLFKASRGMKLEEIISALGLDK